MQYSDWPADGDTDFMITSCLRSQCCCQPERWCYCYKKMRLIKLNLFFWGFLDVVYIDACGWHSLFSHNSHVITQNQSDNIQHKIKLTSFHLANSTNTDTRLHTLSHVDTLSWLIYLLNWMYLMNFVISYTELTSIFVTPNCA